MKPLVRYSVRNIPLVVLLLALGAFAVMYSLSNSTVVSAPEELPTPFPTVILPPMTPVPTRDDVPLESPTLTAAELTKLPPTSAPNLSFNVEINVHCEFPLESSVQRARNVVIGTVREVHPSRWTTDDGQRPAPPWPNGVPEHNIFTPVLFEVEEYLKGEEIAPQFMLYVGEETVGQDSITFDPSALSSLTEGAKAVVFIEKRVVLPFDDTPLWSLTDYYTLSSDGQATNRCQSESIPQEQLITEIRAVVSH
jgi:hypothetical protein